MAQLPLHRSVKDYETLVEIDSYQNEAESHFLSTFKALCDEPGIKAVTFDCFDTVLWRPFRQPSDSFAKFGETLVSLGLIHDTISPDAFRRGRILAERRARERREQAGLFHEVTLSEIYAEYTGFSADVRAALCREEVRHEASLTFVDPLVDQALTYARQAGKTIRVLSNTYFSSRELHELLKGKTHLPFAEAEVLCSSTFRLDKEKGLFGHLIKDLNCLPEQILHVGDNLWGDVDVPRRLGVSTLHYPKVSDVHANIEDRERQFTLIAGQPDDGRMSLLPQWRRTVLASHVQPKSMSASEIIGAYVVGPTLAGFADWVLQEVERNGNGPILCLTREGLFLSEAINSVAAETGRASTICLPFLSSRSIVFPASFFDYSQEEIRTFILSRRTPFTIRSFCAMVGLDRVDADDFGIESVMLDYPLLHGAMMTQALIECMQRHQELKSATLAYAQGQRDIFKVFVDDVFVRYGVLPDHKTLYAVDVGWTGKSQRLLEKVLRACGYDVTLHGLYLASDAGCIEEQLAGLRAKGWLYDAGQPQRSELLGLHCKEIIEQVCSSELGAVKTYSANGDPVFGDDTKTLQQRIDLRRLRNAARSAISLYGKVWRQARERNLEALLTDPIDYRDAYGGLVTFPTLDELTMIGRWSHDENNLSRNVEGLSSPYWETFARYATVQQFLESRSYWKVPELRRSRPALADSLVIRMMGGRHTQQEYSYPMRLGVMADGEPAEYVDRQIYFSADGCAIVPNARICLLTSSFLFENAGHDTLRVEAVLISYYNTATRARIEKVIMPLFMDKPETTHMPSDLPPGASFVVRAEGQQSAIYDSLFGMLSPVSIICCVRKI